MVEVRRQYHGVLDKMQALEQQWEVLKLELELESRENLLIHDIQSLMNKIETGEYYK